MPAYLGKKGQGYIQQIGFCQRCGWKYLRTELTEDDYIKGLLVCCYCHDPDHPQRYPAAPRAEGQPPLTPAPDQYPGPNAPVLIGSYTGAITVDLSWTPSADNADLINEYFVYRSTAGGPYSLIGSVPFEMTLEFVNGQQQWVSSATVFVDDTVAPGGNYSYYVIGQAVDNLLSPQSNVFSIYTQPPAPTLQGVYNYTASAVDLSWSMPLTWVASVTQYQIFKSVNGGSFSLLTTKTGSTTSYVDTAANSYLNIYQYYVVATVTGGALTPDSNVVAAPIVTTTIYTSAATFTKPSGLQEILITAIGAGGGGGSSYTQSGAFSGSSGAGGGGGGYISVTYPASSVPASVAITVGAGGAGGPGGSVTLSGSSPGVNGVSGGSSLFGSLAVANGGTFGGGGTTGTNNTGGAGGTTSHSGGTVVASQAGGTGGNGEECNSGKTSDFVGASTTLAGAGGGGGGYTLSASVAGISPAGGSSTAGSGGAGGAQAIVNGDTGPALAGNGGNGTFASGSLTGGAGGGGGGAASINYLLNSGFSAIAGNGGNGSGYGGGGGGAGCAQNQDGNGLKQSGNGGNGSNGVVIVTTFS